MNNNVPTMYVSFYQDGNGETYRGQPHTRRYSAKREQHYVVSGIASDRPAFLVVVRPKREN